VARKRDLHAIEARQIERACMLKGKMAKAQVARRLGVLRRTVSV